MWHKLVVENDWGSLTFKINEKKAGQGIYKVRWPNGAEEPLRVIRRPYHTTVSDMGHDYGVSTHKLYAQLIYNGAKIEVELEELPVEFEA